MFSQQMEKDDSRFVRSASDPNRRQAAIRKLTSSRRMYSVLLIIACLLVAIIANEGKRVSPVLITRIVDREGQVVFQKTPEVRVRDKSPLYSFNRFVLTKNIIKRHL